MCMLISWTTDGVLALGRRATALHLIAPGVAVVAPDVKKLHARRYTQLSASPMDTKKPHEQTHMKPDSHCQAMVRVSRPRHTPERRRVLNQSA